MHHVNGGSQPDYRQLGMIKNCNLLSFATGGEVVHLRAFLFPRFGRLDGCLDPMDDGLGNSKTQSNRTAQSAISFVTCRSRDAQARVQGMEDLHQFPMDQMEEQAWRVSRL